MPDDCLFCTKRQELDQEALVLHRGELCYVTLNRYPYNNGHLLIAPYAHVASLETLEDDAAAELMGLVKLSLSLLREAYQPDGFNVGANIGSAAGAGVEDHFHMHIVPRWAGDTNYMTSVGKIRIIPEWMDQMYGRLRPLFDRESESHAGRR